MPFVVNHDTQLANLGAMAANVGGYRTAQADQEMALQQQAADLHRQQVMDAIQGGQQREAVNALQYVMGDQRQREINANNAANRLDLAGINGQYGVQRTQAQQEGANTRTADQVSAREREGQANRDSRTQISSDRNAVTTNGQNLGYQATQDRINAGQQRDVDRAEERRALESFKTLQMQQRQGTALDASTRRYMISAELHEIGKLREINERRARDPQSTPEEKAAAAARIGPLNDEAQKRIQALGTLGTQARPSPGVPGGPTPTPYDAQQPGMAQPAPNMNNLMQQPVDGGPGPQSMAPPPVLSHPELGTWHMRGIGADGQPMYERVA